MLVIQSLPTHSPWFHLKTHGHPLQQLHHQCPLMAQCKAPVPNTAQSGQQQSHPPATHHMSSLRLLHLFPHHLSELLWMRLILLHPHRGLHTINRQRLLPPAQQHRFPIVAPVLFTRTIRTMKCYLLKIAVHSQVRCHLHIPPILLIIPLLR